MMVLAAAPAGAQLLDLPEPRSVPARQEERPEPRRKKPPVEKKAEPTSDTPIRRPLEPPPSLVRPTRRDSPPPPIEEPGERQSILVLFLVLLGIGVVLLVVERIRSWVSANVAAHRTLGIVVLLLRLAGAGVLVGIVLELVPEGQDWILWALVALVLVVGWSIRELFADIIAGAVLAAERRVKKGVWVSGDGFQGTVEGRTLRATWLRDGQGHRLTVPNRAMVGAPMVYDAGVDAEHEVVVRLEGYKDASKVRMALTDAILSSPWVLAGANPVVLRDPADPVVWRVRTKLLEPRFSVHFEGELLERVEDLLRYDPNDGDTSSGTTEAPPAAQDSGDPVA
jgi:hypothetical protein